MHTCVHFMSVSLRDECWHSHPQTHIHMYTWMLRMRYTVVLPLLQITEPIVVHPPANGSACTHENSCSALNIHVHIYVCMYMYTHDDIYTHTQ
jgi:hypothetical protein